MSTIIKKIKKKTVNAYELYILDIEYLYVYDNMDSH